MGRCAVCGDTSTMTGSCNYCGKTVCTKHRLPENHDCAAQSTAKTLGPEFRKNDDSGIAGSVTGFLGSEDDGPERQPHCKRCGTKLGDSGETLCSDCQASKDKKRNRAAAEPGDDRDIVGTVLWPMALLWVVLLTLLGWVNRHRIGVTLTVLVIGLGITFGPLALGAVVDHPAAHEFDTTLKSAGDDIESSSAGVLNATEDDESSSDPVVVGGGDATTSEPNTDSSGSSSDLDRSRVERLAHRYVNQERASRGLDELEYNGELVLVARDHGRDMYERDYFAHVSPSGETVRDRYDDAGIRCSTSGENIAQTWAFANVQTDSGLEVYETEEALARAIVDQWMNSSGHRENILRESFSEQGIGIVLVDVDGRVKVFAVQNFC